MSTRVPVYVLSMTMYSWYYSYLTLSLECILYGLRYPASQEAGLSRSRPSNYGARFNGKEPIIATPDKASMALHPAVPVSLSPVKAMLFTSPSTDRTLRLPHDYEVIDDSDPSNSSASQDVCPQNCLPVSLSLTFHKARFIASWWRNGPRLTP